MNMVRLVDVIKSIQQLLNHLMLQMFVAPQSEWTRCPEVMLSTDCVALLL